MFKIAIVGGGLSGTLLAMNLMQSKTSRDVLIKLIDNKNAEELGPAFSTNEDYLLNVRAGMMGAVHNDPEHFWRWLQEKGITASKTDFIKRKIYREYIKEIFISALERRKQNITFERIKDEVIDIRMDKDSTELYLESGNNLSADKVVLAIGNFPPSDPGLKDTSFISSHLYLQNPWTSDFFSKLEQNAEVFIIGTGQTTVDIAIGFHNHGFKGKIHAISRRGFLPMVHRITKPYPEFYSEIKDQKKVIEIFRIIKNHIKKAESSGFDIRAVIDSMRPYTQSIWMNLPTEEKIIFLRHLFRWWEIIRSRIPEESGEIINRMRASGQLNIISGRITGIKAKQDSVDISYIPRFGNSQKNLSADIVINCIGPETDYGKIQNPLVKNLISSGLIQPDPVKQGINALPDGAVIHKDGTSSGVFFTLGFPLRGILWETLAAPEIREQAYNLSHLLLDTN